MTDMEEKTLHEEFLKLSKEELEEVIGGVERSVTKSGRKCPNCHSTNTVYLSNYKVYFCKSCGKGFTKAGKIVAI